MKNNRLAVEIAKDVIARTKMKQLIAAGGSYLYFLEEDKFDDSYCRVNVEQGANLQKEVEKGLKCQVCAIGALFIGTVAKIDDFNMKYTSDSVDDVRMIEKMRTAFTEEELRLIELAFEGRDVGDRYGQERCIAGMIFHDLYGNDSERLIAICRNIIRNNGTFVFPRAVERKARKLSGEYAT